MSRALIAFYSRGGFNLVNGSVKKLLIGNTEVVVGILRNITGADTFRIEPKRPYFDDYYVCIDEARRDLQRGVRPELMRWMNSMERYDTFYLGYPNYWGTMPVAVFSFLEHYAFGGKTIFPFCTHEGGGMGRSECDIQRICHGATICHGLSVKGCEVRQSYPLIKQWLSNNGR